MASYGRFELNRAGIRELMRSDEMGKVCEEYARAALSRLGPGYSVNTRKGRNRVNAEVTADTYEARKENLENNTVMKAVEWSKKL